MNLLVPSGQFGTRSQGGRALRKSPGKPAAELPLPCWLAMLALPSSVAGKDAASARYIYTRLEKSRA